MTYRVVVADTALDDVDRQMPDERGPNGEPSAADFIGLDLIAGVEAMADRWDDLPVRYERLENAGPHAPTTRPR